MNQPNLSGLIGQFEVVKLHCCSFRVGHFQAVYVLLEVIRIGLVDANHMVVDDKVVRVGDDVCS